MNGAFGTVRWPRPGAVRPAGGTLPTSLGAATGPAAPGARSSSPAGGGAMARRAGLGAVLVALAAVGCAPQAHMLPAGEQHIIDRQNVEFPTATELRPYIRNLTAPTAFTFDADGNTIVVEGGIGDYDPSIIGFKPDGTKFNIYPYGSQYLELGAKRFRIYGPIGGIVVYQGKIFVSHRDENDYGVITALDFYGGHRTVVAGLPAQGENGVTQLAVDARSGRLFFGVGSATNSGVVGLDDWVIGWVQRHPDVCDHLGRDNVRLRGPRFTSTDPSAMGLSPELTTTSPLQPFSVSNKTLIKKGGEKPNACICSVPLTGGPIKVEATGFHYPRGLAFNEYGLYFTNDGMEMRGTRPIQDDPDTVTKLIPNTHGGWPDNSTTLEPVTLQKYQPPLEYVIRSGYPDIGLVIDEAASNLVTPSADVLIQGTFPSQSGAAGIAFVPDDSPFVELRGHAIVALSGDRAPFATSGRPLAHTVGYKVAVVNMGRQKVSDLIRNTEDRPASKINGHSEDLLERPIDIKIGPDKAVYVLDLGRMEMKDGKPRVERRTGQIFRLRAVPAAQPADAMPPAPMPPAPIPPTPIPAMPVPVAPAPAGATPPPADSGAAAPSPSAPLVAPRGVEIAPMPEPPVVPAPVAPAPVAPAPAPDLQPVPAATQPAPMSSPS